MFNMNISQTTLSLKVESYNYPYIEWTNDLKDHSVKDLFHDQGHFFENDIYMRVMIRWKQNDEIRWLKINKFLQRFNKWATVLSPS